MKKVLYILLAAAMLAACNKTNDKMGKEMGIESEWDKVFPLSEQVSHRKVTLENQFGLTLVADLYTPKANEKMVNGK